MKKNQKKHESGRSMIEMVGVLAVMGLITAAAFILITSAMRSQKLSRTDDDVAALAAGVRLLYNNATDFRGLDNDALVTLGFENSKSAYGTEYSVAVNSDDAEKFDISFDTPDSGTCAALTKRTWSAGGVSSSACDSGTGKKLTLTFDKMN